MASRWRYEYRIPQIHAEKGRGGLDGARVDGSARDQRGPVEGLAVAAQRELAVNPIGHVVVGLPRDLGMANGFEVEGVEHFAKRRNAAVIAERILLREQG